MSFAVLFSGQGHQHAAMLPWLDDDDLVADMCARLGVADWRAALADPGWAECNANAQPLLTGLALAAWQQLSGRVAAPAAVAGYSVGELAAFSAAGVFEAPTALALAQQRAAAMDAAAAGQPGGLLAVSGLAAHALDELLQRTGLAIAIRNAVDSVILGGPRDALDQAQQIATHAGAQCTLLRVSVASHTPCMHTAAAQFANVLAAQTLRAPTLALFSNATDRVRSAAAAAQALSHQIERTVRWDECLENILALQVRCVLEIGPGQGLARMWNQRYPGIPARACDDFRSAAAIAAWINRHDAD